MQQGDMEAGAKSSWLRRLIGTWTFELATADDSDHPGFTATGTEMVRAVGDVWVAIENQGAGGSGDASHSVTLLGYESEADRFTGAVAGTAVPKLFVYEGRLDDDGRSLMLETSGPAMTNGREVDRYRDVIHIEDENARTTSSQVLGEDGAWREFMSARFRRIV